MRSPTLYLSSVLFHEGAKFCDIDQEGAQSAYGNAIWLGMVRDSLSLREPVIYVLAEFVR